MRGIKQIKNFRLTKELGRGVTGVVYEAVDDVTNKLYAVKAIPSEKLKEPRVMENFKRELKLLHNLNHNNIIKIERVEKTVNNVYLILEYCNGGNLYEYALYFRKTFNQPMPERNVQVILRQLIEGLEYMHNFRIVHRDLKLENILVNFPGVSNIVSAGGMPQKIDYSLMNMDITIKIADLGYARELDGFGVASTLCGTPLTLAPEIIEIMKKTGKHQSYNNRVDLWSLGAITYELLIGRPPFYASNPEQLFQDVLNGIYNLPKNIKLSIEAITFLNGLLQFNPEKRMTWNEIKNHPFIANDFSTFHVIDLKTVETNYENPEQLEVDTKDCENFLWILFKTKLDKVRLDTFDQSVYSDPIIQELEKKILPEIEVFVNGTQDKDITEDEYVDANNEINLADDEENQEKEPSNELKKSSVEKSQQNNQTDNTIFDKIFTEVKQTLKNSYSSKQGSSKEILSDEVKNIVKIDINKETEEIKREELNKAVEEKEEVVANTEELQGNKETNPQEETEKDLLDKEKPSLIQEEPINNPINIEEVRTSDNNGISDLDRKSKNRGGDLIQLLENIKTDAESKIIINY